LIDKTGTEVFAAGVNCGSSAALTADGYKAVVANQVQRQIKMSPEPEICAGLALQSQIML